MGCAKTFTFAKKSEDTFTPLYSASYVASTNRIIGTSMNYLLEFNASTGVLTRSSKALAPLVGPMWINMVGSVPYISATTDPSAADFDPASIAHKRCDVFPVDPVALETGSGLNVWQWDNEYYWGRMQGPNHFVYVGGRIWIAMGGVDWMDLIGVTTAGIPIGPPPWDIKNNDPASFDGFFHCMSTDGTWLYTGSSGYPSVSYYDMNGYEVGWVVIREKPFGTWIYYFPVSIEYVGGTTNTCYFVFGNDMLGKVTSWPAHTFSYIYLNPLMGQTGMRAMRLRYRALDDRLYIPIQNKDAVIVYNTNDGTAEWKSGFDSPVDVVFTPTKAFAVQSGLTGLKEIV